MKQRITALFLLAALLLSFAACGDKGTYQKAIQALDAGNYEEAISLFSEITDYEDSSEKLEQAKRAQMMITYKDQIQLLEANWWVSRAVSVNAMNYFEFKNGAATIGEVWFDGNGRHDSPAAENVPYTIDGEKITTQSPKGEVLEIPYSVSDGKITLDGGAYFSPEMVKEGIQGVWKYAYFDYNSTLKMYSRGEHNIEINGDHMTAESASLSAYDYDTYYYYGPYSGTYKVIIGGFEANLEGKNAGGEWFYNIADGEIIMMHYGNACERTDSLPGEDGYYHLLP